MSSPNHPSNNACTYRFIPSSLIDLPEQRDYDLIIRQQPVRAKMSVPNERDRRPIEPPPILQMKWSNCSADEVKKCLQSPFYFLVANLVRESDPETLLFPPGDYLSGPTVSSLYRLRDIDNSDAAFFVFGDLAVKKEGKYRLLFSLFEIVEGEVQNRKTVMSDVFTVYLPKCFPGPCEGTFLSRAFCDQGVKMRIRKEHRLPFTNGRKRRLERSPVVDKGHSCKHKGGSITMSVFAAPANQNHAVHFGQWQSSPPSAAHAQQPLPPPHLPSGHIVPMAPLPADPHSSVKRKSIYNNLFPSPTSSQYRWDDQLTSLPSPPSTQLASDLAYYQIDRNMPLPRQLTPPPMLADIAGHPHRSLDRLPSLKSIIDLVGVDATNSGTLPPFASSPLSSPSSAPFSSNKAGIAYLLS
ncbi:velvet factor-domain-containing protein [Dichotomocladium elegans]|nr:velvet factor-domain-containing protein [Dichotomocladium elegans]